MKRRRRIGWIVAAFVIFVLVWAVFRSNSRTFLGTIEDGIDIYSAEIVYGPYQIPDIMPWSLREALHDRLPSKLGRIFYDPPYDRSSSRFYTSALAENPGPHLWLSAERDREPVDIGAGAYSPVIVGKDGWAYSPSGSGSWGSGFHKNEEFYIYSYSAYPRWESESRLLFIPNGKLGPQISKDAGFTKQPANGAPIQLSATTAPMYSWDSISSNALESAQRRGIAIKPPKLRGVDRLIVDGATALRAIYAPLELISTAADSAENPWKLDRWRVEDNWGNVSQTLLPPHIRGSTNAPRTIWRVSATLFGDHRAKGASNATLRIPFDWDPELGFAMTNLPVEGDTNDFGVVPVGIIKGGKARFQNTSLISWDPDVASQKYGFRVWNGRDGAELETVSWFPRFVVYFDGKGMPRISARLISDDHGHESYLSADMDRPHSDFRMYTLTGGRTHKVFRCDPLTNAMSATIELTIHRPVEESLYIDQPEIPRETLDDWLDGG